MSKWIAEFDLEDDDTMPEHMDFEYKGTKIDFHCKPLEQETKTDVLNKIRAEIEEYKSRQLALAIGVKDLEKGRQIALEYILAIIDKYRAESEE